ncbi:MAG: response regulator [Lachnospiraceae bacterium]|nr:response regulator [Lachnospiraceae bacterium]
MSERNNRMIMIGKKESFVIRVLMKKTKEAGIDCEYFPCTVDAVNANLKSCSLITLYLEEGYSLPADVLHFMTDNMIEHDLKMILIGEQQDLQAICDQVSGDLIAAKFARPVDNELFVQTVRDHFKKIEEGEFKKRILIVDDDTQYLSLVREWLRDRYKISLANSGLQAIKWLGMNKVDLILLDHEMPVTSGPQVLEMLRSDPETRSIPVMFLTGKGDKESVMAVVALRPEGYFLKTIQREELREKLKEYFTLHK